MDNIAAIAETVGWIFITLIVALVLVAFISVPPGAKYRSTRSRGKEIPGKPHPFDRPLTVRTLKAAINSGTFDAEIARAIARNEARKGN